MAAVLTLQSGSPRADLDEAARIVRCGGVLAIPTESFYALAASIWNEAGLRRVWSIKGRSEGKPILALIADRSQLAEFVIEITPTATLLMEHFWPGPLTLVMRASPS
ncbi:MAG: threonylcarbamoyl-AMP synthase, partial [Nitrospiraceae bacterium]